MISITQADHMVIFFGARFEDSLKNRIIFESLVNEEINIDRKLLGLIKRLGACQQRRIAQSLKISENSAKVVIERNIFKNEIIKLNRGGKIYYQKST